MMENTQSSGQNSEIPSNRFAPPVAEVEPAAKRKGLLPHQKAGRVIRLMAILGVVAVIGIGAAMLLPAMSKGNGIPPFVIATVGFMVAFVVGLFFVAGAVMRHKTWGRYAGIIYGLVSLVSFPIGTLIGGYVLWQLVFGWAEGAAEA